MNTSFNELKECFSLCKSWEERYRLLVQLSRSLPQPTEEELGKMTEIHGCESRLWFEFHLFPRKIQAFSEARLMQGILVIIITLLNELDDVEIASFRLQPILEELQLANHLSNTRLNGLYEIERLIKEKIL